MTNEEMLIDEMREAIIEALVDYDPKAPMEVPCADCAIVDKILSLKTDTCRIAVVRKEPRLPAIVLPDMPKNDLINRTKEAMLLAGYVQEVK